MMLSLDSGISEIQETGGKVKLDGLVSVLTSHTDMGLRLLFRFLQLDNSPMKKVVTLNSA